MFRLNVNGIVQGTIELKRILLGENFEEFIQHCIEKCLDYDDELWNEIAELLEQGEYSVHDNGRDIDVFLCA